MMLKQGVFIRVASPQATNPRNATFTNDVPEVGYSIDLGEGTNALQDRND